MVTTKSKVDDKIKELEERLENVQGRETEKYARIVGYYRAVKNWNKGKKEEYKFRVNYSETIFNRELNGSIEADTETFSADKKVVSSDQEIISYKFFYRTTCPNCPPVKNAVEALELDGESINADSPKGFTKAAIYEIFTAPTVILLDSKGVEVARASNISDLKALLAANNIK